MTFRGISSSLFTKSSLETRELETLGAIRPAVSRRQILFSVEITRRRLETGSHEAETLFDKDMIRTYPDKEMAFVLIRVKMKRTKAGSLWPSRKTPQAKKCNASMAEKRAVRNGEGV